MELFSFNYNGTIVHNDAIVLIYNYLEFGDVLKLRLLNKFNKSLIDENISTFYNKFRNINPQLPSLGSCSLDLSSRIKILISNYNTEILRQYEISNLPVINPIKKSALKGFQHFRKTLKLRNIGISTHMADIIVDRVNSEQYDKICELKKKKLCDYGCYDYATKLNDYSIEKAFELINLGFAWCYAMFAVQKFDNQQIKEMINLKYSGWADSTSYYKIYDRIRMN